MEYGIGRTIVIFQADHRGLGPIVFEIQYVANFRSSPSIDGLIIIANHAKVAVIDRERSDDTVLATVRILIFVNEHVIVFPGLDFPNRFIVLKQLFRTNEQVIKVKCCLKLQLPLVSFVTTGSQVLFVGHGRRVRLFRFDSDVFPLTNDVQEVAWFKHVFVNFDFTKDRSRNTFCVTSIVDGKLFWVPKLACMTLENLHAVRMKGTNCGSERCGLPSPNAFGQFELMGNTFLHFLRGFVRESHGQNAICSRSVSNQVRDSKRHDTRLTRASPCENEKRPRKCINRMLLWGIQFCHDCNLQSLTGKESPIR